MNTKMNPARRLRAGVGKKQLAAIVVLLALGGAGAVAILNMGGAKPAGEESGGHNEAKGHADGEHHGGKGKDSHGDSAGHADTEHHEKAAKGPNGGQMLTEGDFGVELLLTEQGGVPRMKLWLSQGGKAVAPTAGKVTGELTRPGGEVEKLSFNLEKDALVSAQPVPEPHVFEGTLAVQTPKEPFLFTFSEREGVIALSPEQLKAAGVGLEAAGPASIRSTLQLPGEIRFNEDRTAHVVPRVAGVVEAVLVSLGQPVRKGQVLAVISSPTVSEQRAELQGALARQQLARTTYEREKKLFEEKISPQQDVLQAEQALREAEIAINNARQKLQAVGAGTGVGSLNRFELRAPFDGTVVEKHIALGEQVKEDAQVFTLSDLRTVWAQINVPANALPQVRVGERVTIRSTAFDQTASGTVAYVGSLIGEQTRTAPARMVVQNPDAVWRPGLFVTVELTANDATAPVTVSADAVQTQGDKTVVFLQTPNGFVAQPVQTGRSDGKRVEILKGLQAGARHASAGSFVVKAEAGKSSASHGH
ncbi:efflux RND transporter periplasmic adaptor subunit [Aquabacterium sp. J223]|jgi:membrane fusion protein, heavy metal efflux system|uniref:efflux RND transporter periplasmic adaptor subunit n=1 Tax=Aquabacterium sp. J223 TaxID=2898431 RepID=UPI0021ADD2DF|nr:efflux RND transporter periplasmic adaptor subunit [Aquabacterium sp. J223]UUX96649.1 efflux RND transporter periplasmic adaptor subunit [Aquabacterium sp. J223]